MNKVELRAFAVLQAYMGHLYKVAMCQVTDENAKPLNDQYLKSR